LGTTVKVPFLKWELRLYVGTTTLVYIGTPLWFPCKIGRLYSGSHLIRWELLLRFFPAFSLFLFDVACDVMMGRVLVWEII